MITNTANKVIYTGDGNTKQFLIDFPFGDISEINLFLHNISTGEDEAILSNWSYDSSTGYITYPVSGSAMASTHQIVAIRQTPLTQEKDHTVRLFTSEDIETISDKLTREVQDISEKVDRSIKFPASISSGETDAKKYIDDLTDLKNTATSAATTATTEAGIATTQASIATTKASEAATSAQNAATSETNAAASAAAAYTSEQHTIQNEELLQEYVDQAEESATTAVTNATQAASSATSASASATAAATSAQNAATSETNAANSATAAASSANAASGYASDAQSSASTATEKANAANTSATAAAVSATSAETSADNAAASALSASTSASSAQDALAEVQSYRRIDRTYIAGTAIDDYTGSLTVFDLGLDFDLADYVVDVFVNGKGYQGVKSPVDFSVSGDVVTFVEAVPVGAVVQFRINASTTVIIAGSVDVDAKITKHNTSSTAHNDIRTALTTHVGNANIHVTSIDKSNWDAKQASLSTDQIAATNSGVTAAKVSSYDTHVADTDVHVSVSDKAAWNGKQSALSTTQLSATNSGVTSAKVSGYDTHVANGDIHVTATQKAAWTGKQDVISDLATIRSGASAGATAVQPGDLATVATSGAYSDLSGTPTIPTVDQTYSASSANAQSGVAVASAVSSKANTDLSNVNNTGKSTAAEWAMPSTAYTDLTLGASGTEYTAPANGLFYVHKAGSGTGQYLTVTNLTANFQQIGYDSTNGAQITSIISVRKGDKIIIGYSLGGQTYHFRFIYAEGSKSEAN